MTELTDVIYKRIETTHIMESVSVISVVSTKRYRGYDDVRVLVRRSVATESLRVWSLFYLWENDYTPFIVVGHEYDRSSDTIVVEAVSVEYNLSRWPAVHTMGSTIFMDENDYMFEWGDPYGEASNLYLFDIMHTVWERTVSLRYGRAEGIPRFTDLFYGWVLNLHDDNRIYSDEAQYVPYYRVDRSMTIHDFFVDILAKSRMGYISRYIPPSRNYRTSGNYSGLYLDVVRPIYRLATIADPFRVSPQSFTNSAYTIDVRDSNNYVITSSEDYVHVAHAVEPHYDNPASYLLGYKEVLTDDFSSKQWWESNMENMVYSPATSILQAYTFTVESVNPTFQMNREYVIGDAVYCHVPGIRDIDQAEGEFRWMQVVEQTSSWGPEGYRTYPTVAFPESGPGYNNTLEYMLQNNWNTYAWH